MKGLPCDHCTMVELRLDLRSCTEVRYKVEDKNVAHLMKFRQNHQYLQLYEFICYSDTTSIIIYVIVKILNSVKI